MNVRVKNALPIAAVLAAGGAGFWLGHDARPVPAAAGEERAAESEAPAALVRTRPLARGTLTRVVEAYGTVQPAPGSSVNLSVPFESAIRKVSAAPGTAVEAGTPILEVSPTAEAQLQIRQAQDALAAAERNLAQARRRLAEQLATNADVATAEQAMQTAKTQVDSLSRRGAEAGHVLTAGIAGVVTQVNVQPGQVSPAGTALAVVSPLHSAEVTVGVEPSEVPLMSLGAAVRLWDVHAGDDAPPVVGTLRRIGRQINVQTRLRDVSITLADDGLLLPGAFVTAALPTSTDSGWVVPRSAVLPVDGEQVVFVVVDEKAKRRVVKVVMSDRERTLIAGDDLREGDAIVVSGAAELEEGALVRFEPAEEAPTTAAATAQANAATVPSTAPTTLPSAAPSGEAK